MRKPVPGTRRQPTGRPTATSLAGLLLVSLAVAGCSNVAGTKAAKSGRPVTCTFIAKLDSIANTVAEADVHDPETFDATLQAAVRDYVSNVHQLRAVAPGDLSASLAQVEADVQQLRFDAAVSDRAPLDEYAARTCGRVAATATTSRVAGSTTTTAGSGSTPATTASAGPTTTTTPSNG